MGRAAAAAAAAAEHDGAAGAAGSEAAAPAAPASPAAPGGPPQPPSAAPRLTIVAGVDAGCDASVAAVRDAVHGIPVGLVIANAGILGVDTLQALDLPAVRQQVGGRCGSERARVWQRAGGCRSILVCAR